MTTQKDREYDGQSAPPRADDLGGMGRAGVRLDEVAALVRDARRLIGTRSSKCERTAFLTEKARLLRRLEEPDGQACRGGESR